jgi:hypothetical protein
MEAFGLENDIELAVLMLDDIALADAACDDLCHDRGILSYIGGDDWEAY